jgi:FkbM family methyltransferase
LSQPIWRRQVKRLFRQFGFDLIRFHPESSDDATLSAVLKHLGTDLVFDIGANKGQYGQSLRDVGYMGRVVSFEPLTSAHALLTRTASGDANWVVHPRGAIGDHDGELSINIAGNNVSSSALPMLKQLAQAAPESLYVGSEKTPLARLDTVAPAYVQGAKSVFVKIDTQGFEAPVLRGATQVLQNCRAVQLELSLTALYEGQELWEFFLADLTQRGFQLWTVLPGFMEVSTGRTLQMDAIFVRR